LLLFRANNAQVGQFWSTGNFTIQTGGTYIDAGYKLDVKGSTRVQGAGTTSATTALRVENTNASASLVVLDNGFVGINTGSAQYNLDVNGTARVGGSSATALTVERFSMNSNILIEYKNGTTSWFAGHSSQNTFGIGKTSNLATETIFNIRSNGNVLIGATTDSGFKLDVSGSARITNGLAVTGSLDVQGDIKQNGTSLQVLAIAYAIALG
jgi:hypothetical protein